MKKGFHFGLIALLAAFMFVSCQNEGSDTPTSKPILGADDKPVKVASNQVDPSGKEDGKIHAIDQKKAQESTSSNLPSTVMTFKEYEHHFGTLNEGDKPEHIFTFTNDGSEPLVLEKCKGSCGCTVPTCPKEPIPPGGSGEIKVVFNSKGKKNHQEKRVTITANTEPISTVLKIIADVTPEVPAE